MQHVEGLDISRAEPVPGEPGPSALLMNSFVTEAMTSKPLKSRHQEAILNASFTAR